ncbi:MAG: hypothetical protein P1U61_07755 [Legionellaceae bacterium]|nr:hypothetical protein [Legionellaceae bacterium]
MYDLRNQLRKDYLFLSLVPFTFCSMLQAATANTLYSITLKTPTQMRIPNGSVATAVYEVENHLKTPMSLNMKAIPGVRAISNGGNACPTPFRLSKNKKCDLVLQIDPSKLINAYIKPTICNTTAAIPFSCSEATPANTLTITRIEPATKTAVGVNQDTAEDTTLLVQSINGGITWNTVDVSHTPDGGQFFNTACSGSGVGTYCFAVGGTPDGAAAYTVPPFITSTSSDGLLWRLIPIIGAPALGNFYGASCTNDAQFCNAVGDAIVYDSTGTTIISSPPLIAQSRDYGQNWAVKAITGDNIPADASFISSDCAGTLCVASGQSLVSPGELHSTSNSPFLAQTTDNGASWSVVSVPNAPAHGYFYHVNCSEHNHRAMCVTVGQDYTHTSPLLAQTNNSGAQWNTVPLPTTIKNGYLNDISCLGDKCVAVGATFEEEPDGSRIYQPLTFQTTNSGISWSVVDIKGMSAVKNGMLYTVHSTGSGDNTMFVTGGANYETEKPLLAQTIDGGANWSVVNVPNNPLGWYNTVSCSGELSTATCTAVGQIDLSPSAPLIAQTRNGGENWSVVASSTISNIPKQGVFYWGASTGG